MEDSYPYDPRSRSMQIQPYNGGPPPRSDNLRHPPPYSYSFSHSSGAITPYPNPNPNKDSDFKKPNKNFNTSWSFAADPEFQRKKRVASYKMYGVEGKVKGTFRKSFRWLKDNCTRVVYGWW